MKILVTGGAGFIGSAVIRLAVSRGHAVVNLDALTYAACLTNVAPVADSSLYAFEQADIRDRAALDKVFSIHQPDIVMHLAAESHVDRSIDSPGYFIETNITGTFNMLEAARKYWVEFGKPENFRFHHISTDEVFGSLPSDPAVLFTEDTPYDPRSPYSASKAASDHLVRAWHATYGLPVVLSNCSNNYGPYHFPEKLIPVVILNALAGKLCRFMAMVAISAIGFMLRITRMRCYLSPPRGRWDAAIISAAKTSVPTCNWCKTSALFSTGCGRVKRALMPISSPLSPTGPAMTRATRSIPVASAKNWAGGLRLL